MKEDRRRLESLNPEPDGGRGFADTDAGRRTRARVEARLDATTLGLEAAPVARKHTAWLIAAPALVVALAVGLPLVFLRGSGTAGTSGAPAATTTPGTAGTTVAPPVTTSTLPVSAIVYQYSGMVLDKAGVGPQLCMAVAFSLPPQCGGMPVAGLDWAAIPWAETVGDTTWAEARLVGTFDGEQFTLTRAPERAADQPAPEPDPFASPCLEPSGGWVVTDPGHATQEAFDAAQSYAAAQPEYAGLWIDQLGAPAVEGGFDAASFVLNVTFTGDPAGHEAALREIYGGPLCVGGAERSAAELDSVVAGLPVVLASAEAEAAGIYARMGGTYATDVMHNVVVATVFAVTGDGQEWVDARYGPGVVELSSMLTPVEGS
jgi:hypothetical protein